MKRRLKNILGISLMILAVLISQMPTSEVQAEKTITVTFSMNGGSFDGTYNGYNFKNQSPVLVIDSNEKISSYPSDVSVSYDGYKTESGKWYTDKECLVEFDKTSKVTDSITLYKKWYNITSDGSTLADSGFYLNPDGNILYKYDGNSIHVEIPGTVTVIAKAAFDNLEGVRGITLPANIERIEDGAFSGAESGENIIYIYDSETSKSELMGKMLDDQYDQLVYSAYLDIEDVEEIAGIDYGESRNTEKQQTVDNEKVISQQTVSEEEKEIASETNLEQEKETTSETKSEQEKETTSETKSEQENEMVSEIKPEVESETTAETMLADTLSGDVSDIIVSDSNTLGGNTVAALISNTVERVNSAIANANAAKARAILEEKESALSENTAETQETISGATGTSASAPKSDVHVKDATPKTGDPVEYRMLLVCCLFSIGVLLLLTGNGNKRKAAVS